MNNVNDLSTALNQSRGPNKGIYGGECYRTTCSNGNAVYFNKSTRMHYCEECATLINNANRKDSLAMYGTVLCEYVDGAQESIKTELDEVHKLREKARGIEYMRVTQKDKKGRERKSTFKDQFRASLAAKRRADNA